MIQVGDLVVVHFIADQNVGTTFERSRGAWPLHFTLMPWFAADDVELLSKRLRDYATTTPSSSIQIGREEQFGADTNVNIIEDQSYLAGLHRDLFALVNLACEARDATWTGTNYKAHVTHQSGSRMHEGDIVAVNDVSLVELQTENTCLVRERFMLGVNT